MLACSAQPNSRQQAVEKEHAALPAGLQASRTGSPCPEDPLDASDHVMAFRQRLYRQGEAGRQGVESSYAQFSD